MQGSRPAPRPAADTPHQKLRAGVEALGVGSRLIFAARGSVCSDSRSMAIHASVQGARPIKTTLQWLRSSPPRRAHLARIPLPPH